MKKIVRLLVVLIVLGLLLGETIVILQGKVAAIDAAANRQWLASHWGWIALVLVGLWLIRWREANRYQRGYRDGCIRGAKLLTAVANRHELAGKLEADGGFHKAY